MQEPFSSDVPVLPFLSIKLNCVNKIQEIHEWEYKCTYRIINILLLLLLSYIYIYLIKVRRDHSPSQYGPCYGSHQGDIQPSKHVTDHPGFTK